MAQTTKQRPGTMRLWDATQYRLPPAGIVSILHRVSGILMFVLMPFVIWMFDTSLSSEVTYGQFTGVFVGGAGFVPAWFFKLTVLALIWAFLHHLLAGLRHLWMDVSHDAVTKEFGNVSALVAIGASLTLTLVFGFALFFF